MAAAVAARQRGEETNELLDEELIGAETTTSPEEEGRHSLDRYFIVKSLTVEDLELSKKSGIWATQSHNEVNLNHAFEVSGSLSWPALLLSNSYTTTTGSRPCISDILCQ